VARAHFGLGDGTVALVVGGSQGSRALNEALLADLQGVVGGTLPSRPAGLEILWATGPGNFDSVRDRLAGLGVSDWVHITPYINEMPKALASADVAISRAGAMALSELCAWGIPSVLIPLPTAAANHQHHNAVALADAGRPCSRRRASWRAGASGSSSAGSPATRRAGRLAERARERGHPQAAAEDRRGAQPPAVARQLAACSSIPHGKHILTAHDLLELARRKPIHFMGIGGAGMAPLAELVLRQGGRVTGCDAKLNPVALSLREHGAEVTSGHDPSHVEGCSALVVTSAVRPDHPEMEAARAAGIPILKRAQALGAIVNHGTVVAIAGTHGKTTTTALTTATLAAAELAPTGLVGGRVPAWGGNLHAGGDSLFVVEADEYDRSFLTLRPTVAVVTTLEADHLDIYGTLEGVEEAFAEFLGAVEPDGLIVACADDSGVGRILPRLSGRPERVLTYGTGAGAMLRAENVRSEGVSATFEVRERGTLLGEASIRLPGLHNVRNALAAVGVARHLGVEWDAIVRGLASYQGVARRFEMIGDAAGVLVIDDYAHHPTELAATLRAARAAYPDRRLVAVFQPHLYSRTRDFAQEFGAPWRWRTSPSSPTSTPRARRPGGPPGLIEMNEKMNPLIVAGLDIGSTKTAAVIAEVQAEDPKHPRIKILGVGQSRTGGIRRELVTDIEATTESVRKAVKEAELMAGVSVDGLFVGIAGEHIHARTSNGVVAVGGEEIDARDVERVQEVAKAIVVPVDREVLHAIPQEYIVDAQGGIRDPIGMAGTRLEAEVFIVTGSSTAAQNLRKAISRAGYRVSALVLEPIASALATLSEDEKELGVALVELGGGTTDVTIFHERKIRHAGNPPLGRVHGDQRHREGALAPVRGGGPGQGAVRGRPRGRHRPERDLRGHRPGSRADQARPP
jgi:UDP-N-acetylmuramate--alanine ligase